MNAGQIRQQNAHEPDLRMSTQCAAVLFRLVPSWTTSVAANADDHQTRTEPVPQPETQVERSGASDCSPPATLPRKYLRDFPSDVQKRILAEIKRKNGEVKNGEYEFDIESLVVNFSPSESLRLYDPDYQLLKIRD